MVEVNTSTLFFFKIMTQGYFSTTNRYKKLSEEEREKAKVKMAEYYYKRTKDKVSRRKKPYKLPDGQKDRSIYDVGQKD